MNFKCLKSIVFLLLTCFSLSLSAKEVPLEAWVHDPIIDAVSVNPSGTYLSALTLAKVNEAPFATIWDVKDLSKTPKRFRPKKSKLIGLQWLSDDMLFAVGRQKFDYRFGGKVTKWFRNIPYILNPKTGEFRELMRHRNDIRSVSVVNRLAEKPDKVLVSVVSAQGNEEYLELDLKRLTTKRVFRGDDRSSFSIDTLGNVAVRQQIAGSGENIQLITSLKSSKDGDWVEHFTFYASKREGVGLDGITVTADGTVYVTDNTGRDKTVVRKYNPVRRELSEPVFIGENYEILGVVTSPYPSPGESDLIGYQVAGPAIETVYTDPLYAQLQKKIDSALPKSQVHRMTSMSKDLKLIVVLSSSPREPGSYSLLVDGRQLLPLGRRYPNINPEDMSDMKFVTYKARDGLEIPAFLTIPSSGKPPYPAVIMPHGGPWARDYLGWDMWAQFLANRGYAVLQPQYRGSQGWGQKLWRAGDREWGQKMQDDKDDGAQWLVEQGITTKDRIAIYGYSYGGYAAMAATVREDSPYQCAIAGAGLSELDTFDKITFENPFNREFQNPTIAGVSPYFNAEKANIPLFIFHGDRDQRVPVDQSRKFFDKLEELNKPVKYMEIPDLWHSMPWFPQHHYAVLSSLEEYLKNDCGPGGL
ncbi:prolyl oligopeptidase family serine peptidase [Microbulbifer thermotolerans]|uniref:alpha/beta hydrolase family protein n=1 Tax=Microbulbifer thermotolerans TaxID=252514 RepID=UPI00224B4D08|nr:prolyl oligopeptidase family serine peptidase [Microbulbifer thermotolerans]MCX2780917.1 prolyl oligopeptidase family serine peptidase [Microbulbifer thermotolerans]MCX2782098.1 prolyl oligopeptidase family serine peptidase [Microbulbifer thermotolerans]MCX2806256.1 prolyl oligopeptidase family serine peptidase [Microbulbifer thermotolerans]MCX2843114.1 prolyl oligopeptidase family serine peptidase [Microbulbifer thermotolerans]